MRRLTKTCAHCAQRFQTMGPRQINCSALCYLANKTKPQANGCVLWTGTTPGESGYATVSIHGVRSLVHRLAYQTLVGPIPDGLYVCHHCDVPLCVNPDHLFLGTALANIHDCLRKGRNRTSGKLTEEKVIWIREQLKVHRHGNMSRIARELGVSKALIRNIRNGTAWGYVQKSY